MLGAAIQFGGAVATAAIRPAASGVTAGLRLQRAARERLAARLGEGALGALEAVLASSLAAEAVDRTLASGLTGRALDRALEGPLVDRVAQDVVRYAVVERLLADDAVDRLLASEELWTLVEAIVQSPTVTDAITRQSAGFADQVAGGMRARSRRADARIERAARRAMRKGPQ